MPVSSVRKGRDAVKPSFAPSMMCMDYLKIQEQMGILNERADLYHVDVMDGHFCKNMALSPDIVRAFGILARLPMEAHLMTTNPEDWLSVFAQAGVSILSPHAETLRGKADRVFDEIEALGCRVGLTLCPGTPLSEVRGCLGRVERLTIMTVQPGFAGQAFLEDMLEKVSEAKALREELGASFVIQADGACNASTFSRLRAAGADCFVAGSTGLFSLHEDLERAWEMMLLDAGVQE